MFDFYIVLDYPFPKEAYEFIYFKMREQLNKRIKKHRIKCNVYKIRKIKIKGIESYKKGD